MTFTRPRLLFRLHIIKLLVNTYSIIIPQLSDYLPTRLITNYDNSTFLYSILIYCQQIIVQESKIPVITDNAKYETETLDISTKGPKSGESMGMTQGNPLWYTPLRSFYRIYPSIFLRVSGYFSFFGRNQFNR